MGRRDRKKEELMAGIYIMLGGMVLFATVVGVLDLLGQRQKRREQKGNR